MISEDYVSFEVAKLLKEKGFDERCFSFYWSDGSLDANSHDKKTNLRNSTSSNPVAPTLQMAMKWLRENFNINPVPYALSLGWAFDIFDLSNRDITGCKKIFSMDLPSKSECYNSYEEACEAAIRYTLENLI